MSAADLGRLLLLAAVWGLAFVFIRVAVAPLGPVALTEVRALIAGLLLALYARSRGARFDVGTRWRQYLALGALNSAVPFVLIAAAEEVMIASYTAILVSTSPLLAAVIAAAALAEPLRTGPVCGLLLGIAGVSLLVGWNPAGESAPPAWAIAATLGAALFYALAGLYARLAMKGVAPIAAAAASQLSAALLLLLPLPAMPPVAMPNLFEWISAIALAVLSSGLAFVVYFQLIERVGPVKTLTVNFLTPLFGIAGGALLLGERITANMIAGTLVILIGTALVIGVPGAAQRNT
jgi:drug/metabolite transporter (DMT)-like permease